MALGRLYLYAIIAHPEKPSRVTRGLDGSRLSVLVFQDLGAVVGPMAVAFARPGEDSLWRHARVIEGLMGERAVLPMRFGTHVPGTSHLRALLAAHYRELADAMEKLEGRCECTVRVLSRSRVPAADAQVLAAEIHKTFAMTGADGFAQVLVTPRVLLTGTYLVDETRADSLRQQVESLSAGHPDLRFLLSGPTPAYSFVPPLDERAEAAADFV
jgi:hypothetical protein